MYYRLEWDIEREGTGARDDERKADDEEKEGRARRDGEEGPRGAALRGVGLQLVRALVVESGMDILLAGSLLGRGWCRADLLGETCDRKDVRTTVLARRRFDSSRGLLTGLDMGALLAISDDKLSVVPSSLWRSPSRPNRQRVPGHEHLVGPALYEFL